MKKILLITMLISSCGGGESTYDKPSKISCDSDKAASTEVHGERSGESHYWRNGSRFTYWHYPKQGFDLSFEENDNNWACVVKFTYYAPY
jgi:hypothetical protein